MRGLERITAQKGTKDVLPAESYRWQHLEGALRDTVASFGDKEIRLPTFEATELFTRGVGETTDVVGKEMYTFNDKGGRSITLRPEGTANTVRAILEHGLLGEALPVRAYYLQSCFRYEKPQSGRLREFHQLGVEMFGAAAPEADVQVIATAAACIRKAGLKKVQLQLNSIGCPNCRPHYNEALKAYFVPHLEELCPTCRERYARNPLRLLDCKEKKCSQLAEQAPKIVEYLCPECEAHFQALQSYLRKLGIDFAINPKIVRGLDYYTKTVFEIISSEIGAQGTVCGGGRYDGLVSQLGGPEMPGIGFGMGIERLLMVMESAGVIIPEPQPLQIFLCTMGQAAREKAFQLLGQLRRAGISADMDHAARSMKAQFKYADKLGAKYTLSIGDNELEKGKANLKNMEDGCQVEVSLDEVSSWMHAE